MQVYLIARGRIKLEHVQALMVAAHGDGLNHPAAAQQLYIVILHQLGRHAGALLYLAVGAHGHADGIFEIGVEHEPQFAYLLFAVKGHGQRFAAGSEAVGLPAVKVRADFAGYAVDHILRVDARLAGGSREARRARQIVRVGIGKAGQVPAVAQDILLHLAHEGRKLTGQAMMLDAARRRQTHRLAADGAAADDARGGQTHAAGADIAPRHEQVIDVAGVIAAVGDGIHAS